MNFLRRLFVENATLKIISLLLAFLLWLQIAGQQMVQRSVAVPLEFINMPTELVITNEYPKEVSVLISKPSSVRMDEQNLAAVIDLSGVRAGSELVPLTERDIENLPSGVEIESIEQRRIRLQLEQTRRKHVRVDPEIVGDPEDGFEVNEVQSMPSEVLIIGPESRLERISSADTAAIDVGGRRASFAQEVVLDLEDPSLRIEGTTSVNVFVIIEEERRKIRFARVPVRLASDTAKAKISPRTVEVILTVPVSFEGELDRSEIAAVVTTQEAGSSPEAFEASPQIAIPEEYEAFVEVKSVTPPVVKVTLQR